MGSGPRQDAREHWLDSVPARDRVGSPRTRTGASRRVRRDGLGAAAGRRARAWDGWYHPGAVRYDWRWLANHCHADPKGAITREQFAGTDEFFRRLDRDHDGVLKAADFDWSDAAAVHQERQRFKAIDFDGNGQISSTEWSAFFQSAAKGGTDLTFDDFAAAFKPAASRAARGDGASRQRSRMIKWLRAVIRCDVGSYFEGPGLNQPAPDFTLSERDGNRQLTLSKLRGNKPLVLVLGSFSCGGFRTHYRAVEDLQRRYGDEVRFLAIYVREAHPTDGLRSGGNDRVGITIKQPIRKADREAACASVPRPTRRDDPDGRGRDERSRRPRLQRHAEPVVLDRRGRQGREKRAAGDLSASRWRVGTGNPHDALRAGDGLAS